jgi:hypothetical protein
LGLLKHAEDLWEFLCMEFGTAVGSGEWFTVKQATQRLPWPQSENTKRNYVSLVLHSALLTVDPEQPAIEHIGQRWKFVPLPAA